MQCPANPTWPPSCIISLWSVLTTQWALVDKRLQICPVHVARKKLLGNKRANPQEKLGPSSGLACHTDACHRPLGPAEGGYGDCVSAPVIREGGKQSFPLYLSRVESFRSALAWHIHLLSLPREMVEKGRLIYLVTCVPTSAREKKKREKRKN